MSYDQGGDIQVAREAPSPDEALPLLNQEADLEPFFISDYAISRLPARMSYVFLGSQPVWFAQLKAETNFNPTYTKYVMPSDEGWVPEMSGKLVDIRRPDPALAPAPASVADTPLVEPELVQIPESAQEIFAVTSELLAQLKQGMEALTFGAGVSTTDRPVIREGVADLLRVETSLREAIDILEFYADSDPLEVNNDETVESARGDLVGLLDDLTLRSWGQACPPASQLRSTLDAYVAQASAQLQAHMQQYYGITATSVEIGTFCDEESEDPAAVSVKYIAASSESQVGTVASIQGFGYVFNDGTLYRRVHVATYERAASIEQDTVEPE